MEEVKKITVPKKPTIKQLYLLAAGQEIGMDYFLFTCFEEEKTIAGLVGRHLKLNNKKRYPLLATDRRGELNEGLSQAREALLSWYGERYPFLGGTAVLDYSIHGEMLAPFVLMLLDIRELNRLKEQPLPMRLAAESDLENDPAWAEVLAQLHSHFSAYYRFMIAYIAWLTKAPSTSPLDLTSVPPVGRYLQLLHEARRRAERKANQGSYSSGGERSERPSYGGPPPRGGEGGGNDRNKSRSESGNSRGFDRGPRRNDRESSYRSSERRQGGEHPQERNQEALHQVEQGVNTLKKNSLLKELILPPQNSFVRREQHQRVKELGFTSSSTGEEDGRAVKITRSKKAK